MKTQAFYFPYTGTKRREHKHISEQVEAFLDLHHEVTTVVEPFCGSCAFSYQLFLKYGNRFEYVMNDSDPRLVELYTFVKEHGSKPLFDFVAEKKKD